MAERTTYHRHDYALYPGYRRVPFPAPRLSPGPDIHARRHEAIPHEKVLSAVFIFAPVPCIANLPSLSFVRLCLCGVKMYGKVLVFADSKRLTWRELVQRVLEELGEQVTLDGIYSKAEKQARRLSVPTWMATIRRTLHEFATSLAQGVWKVQNT